MNERFSQNPPQFDWQWHSFAQLNGSQLYQILRLRQQVFIIEQQCAYGDIDNLDQSAFHLCGTDPASHSLQACLRVLPPGALFDETSIGRVVTASDSRSGGLGHELMRRSVEFCRDRFTGTAIRISAQSHLQQFYASHGFETVTAEHLIDEILHVEMLLH
ncbi:MAG: GNAT family N-acetyltransferase [Fuerstiella sp.]|nr:GNAT family N-acetyltransferase [Fuerstiella sp.]MCP4782883.1 GNAT family N-acetyltransferase [Fuerstiella sp.]MCP4857751.1 GNAT family N-acetyltransferase [Fuerstiella sp.]